MTLLEQIIQAAFRAAQTNKGAMMLWRTTQELAFDLAKIRSDCDAEIEAINANRDLCEAMIKNDVAILKKSAASDIFKAKNRIDQLMERHDPLVRCSKAFQDLEVYLDTLRQHDAARHRRDQRLAEHQRQVNTVAGYWHQRTAYAGRTK